MMRTTMRTTMLFFLITYAVTWSFWFAAAAAANASATLSSVFVLLGTLAPALVAIGMTLQAAGTRAVRTLLARLFQWRVGVRWYVFAIGFMVAVKLTMAVIHRAAFGAWPAFGQTPVPLMLAATLVSLVVLGQSGEELGWRGYALPRLAPRLGLGWASIVLGVVWAVWHLPIFFIFPSADKYGQSFPIYLVQVVALSVAFAWLWWRANGSLLLTMLLHAAVNNTKDIVPSVTSGAPGVWALSASRPALITAVVLWMCAAGFLLDMRRARSTLPPT
jgi:membrane protease YdiL (CAAX protease family)